MEKKKSIRPKQNNAPKPPKHRAHHKKPEPPAEEKKTEPSDKTDPDDELGIIQPEFGF